MTTQTNGWYAGAQRTAILAAGPRYYGGIHATSTPWGVPHYWAGTGGQGGPAYSRARATIPDNWSETHPLPAVRRANGQAPMIPCRGLPLRLAAGLRHCSCTRGYYEQGDLAVDGPPKRLVKRAAPGPRAERERTQAGPGSTGGRPPQTRHLHRLHDAGLPSKFTPFMDAIRRARLDDGVHPYGTGDPFPRLHRQDRRKACKKGSDLLTGLPQAQRQYPGSTVPPGCGALTAARGISHYCRVHRPRRDERTDDPGIVGSWDLYEESTSSRRGSPSVTSSIFRLQHLFMRRGKYPRDAHFITSWVAAQYTSLSATRAWPTGSGRHLGERIINLGEHC